MKTLRKLCTTNGKIALCLYAMLLSGCFAYGQQDFFRPKAIPTPFHDQSKQLIGTLGYDGGFDLNCSYSFKDHMSLFATATLDVLPQKVRTILGNEYKILRNDIAASLGGSYYWNGDRMIFDANLGVGLNKIDNQWRLIGNPERKDFTYADYWNVFSHVSIGRKVEGLIFGLASRVSYATYSTFEFYSTDYQTEPNTYKNLPLLSFEPALFLDLKIIDNLSFNTQLRMAIPYYGEEFIKAIGPRNGTYTYEGYSITVKERGDLYLRCCVRYKLNL